MIIKKLLYLLPILVSLWGFNPVPSQADAATITVAWDAPAIEQLPLIQGYNLYRAAGACAAQPVTPFATKVGTLASQTAVTMADTVSVNGLVCYELTAYGLGGESGRSNRAEGLVKILPFKPGNLRIVVTVTP